MARQTSGSKSGNTSTKTRASSTSKPRNTTKTKQKNINRPLYGIIYIAFGLVTLFSLLGFDGFLLSGYKNAVAFLIGYGIYALPISLLIVGGLCFTNFRENTVLRMSAFFVFPLLTSCFTQLVVYGSTFTLSFDSFSIIIDRATKIESAGLIGGFFSIILESSLSSIGALILLLLAMIACMFIAFNRTPLQLFEFVRTYFEELAYEEDDEEVEYKLSEKEKRKARKERQKEYNLKLKEAKAQAFKEEKEKASVKTPKKYKQYSFDLDLEDKVTFNVADEDKPKIDAWVVAEYEKIRQRDELEAKRIREQRAHERELLHSINDEDIIPTDLEDLTLIERPDELDGMTEEVETGIEQGEIIYLNNQNFDLSQDIAKEVEEILEHKEELIQAVSESGLENTMDYSYNKKEITPDELKSTMKYETTSNFDKDSFGYKYSFPPISLLSEKIKENVVDPEIELRDSSKRLIETLNSFSIQAQIINIVRGPSITRFEITIAKGIKFSKITSLSDDIALSLGASNVRIATIPDKVAIGIEVPNKNTEIVPIREVLDSNEFRNTTSKLSYALGKDITGKPAIGDIAKMPHMLIAGTTGSGKSVCVNSMIVSLLYKSDPTEVKFIMIDPKMVELGGYNGIPHLLIPVVTDPKKAAGALNWAVGEMLRRYKMLAECNVKDIASYNMVMATRIEQGDEEAVKMPQIVIVIDELADLMMISAKEVEESICRIAQMARAAGMHLVIATQRPSSDVITGIMKANIPSRVSFAVSSQIESRIILDTPGAEKLIGKGDMLYNPLGTSKPIRLQGCFITSSEVEAVVEYVKMVAEPDYNEEVLAHIENHSSKDSKDSVDMSDDDDDDLLNDAIDVIVSTGQASTSFLQRKLKVGYARASRIMDQIEDRGIISQQDGAKPRQILITKLEWQEMKARRTD